MSSSSRMHKKHSSRKLPSNLTDVTMKPEEDIFKVCLDGDSKKLQTILAADKSAVEKTKDGHGTIYAAVKGKNAECVKLLLENGAKINIQTKIDAVSEAMDQDSVDIIKLFEKYKFFSHGKFVNSEPLLFYAYAKKAYKVIDYLAQKPAFLNATDRIGNNFIMVIANEKSLFNKIIKYNPEIVTNKLDENIFDIATRFNTFDVLNTLLENKEICDNKNLVKVVEKLNSKMRSSGNKFHSKENIKNDILKEINICLTKDVDLSESCEPLVCDAILAKEIELAIKYLEHKADISIKEDQRLPLYYAVVENETKLALEIIKRTKSIDCSVTNYLLYAVSNSNTELAIALLEKKCTVDTAVIIKAAEKEMTDFIDKIKGTTMTMEAVEWIINNKELKGCKTLLKSAKIDPKSDIFIAARSGFCSVIRRIMEEQKTLNFVSEKDGTTPLMESVPVCMDIFLDSDIPIDAVDYKGRTALIHQICSGRIENVKRLINKGANLSIVDKSGLSALNYAIIKGYNGLITELIKHKAPLEDNKMNPPIVTAAKFIKNQNFFIQTFDVVKDKDAQDMKGETALMCAIKYKYDKIVDFLLKDVKDINKKSLDGTTALLIASQKNEETALKLIKNGADIKMIDNTERSAVHYAAESGFANLLKELIKKGSDICKPDKNSQTPIMIALAKGNRDVVETLLSSIKIEKLTSKGDNILIPLFAKMNYSEICIKLIEGGGNINTLDTFNSSALHYAVINADNRLVNYLVDNKADINVKDKFYGRTPLIYALINNNENIAKILIRNGADVNTEGNDFKTPLHYSVINKMAEITSILVEKGADFNKKDESDTTPLATAISNLDEISINIFLNDKSDVSIFTKTDESSKKKAIMHMEMNESLHEILTDLFDAAKNKNVKKVEELLKIDFIKNCQDPKCGKTLACVAAKDDNVELMNLLISKNTDINKPSFNKKTPLMYAALYKSHHVARILLENGAKVNQKDGDDQTALHFAASSGCDKILKLLVKAGANINAVDKEGYTPLHISLTFDNTHLSKLLIENCHANLKIANKYGETPLIVSVRNKHDVNTISIVENGADVNAKDNEGNTPLLIAARLGSPFILQYLIYKKADINVVNNNNECPYYCACLDYSKEKCNILLNSTQFCPRETPDGKSLELFWEIYDTIEKYKKLCEISNPFQVIENSDFEEFNKRIERHKKYIMKK